MKASGIQLEMSFEENGNRFKERLDNGVFFIAFEVNPPPKQTPLDTAAARMADFEYEALSSTRIPACLAFADKSRTVDSWSVADFAPALCKTGRDNHLVCLSGRNAGLKELEEVMTVCGNAGFKSFVTMSGDAFPGENSKATRKRQFTESIHITRMLKEKKIFFGGSTVNSFKYSPVGCFSQYFKLVKKLHLGADFIIAQAGWDMMKLQELRWYLNNRNLHYPAIARIMMLTPERVDDILKGRYPGIVISRDFEKMLLRETMHSYAQFESAQWRRIQIQAAGCKLMGFSGIQLAGLESAAQIRIACRRISEAFEEFKTFEDWKNAYDEYYSRIEMAPYPERFYIFNKLLSQAHPDENIKMKDADFPPCSAMELFKFKVSDFLFSNAHNEKPYEHALYKHVISGCRNCSQCRLPYTAYVCPETCPKGMSNGPCGGSRSGGRCEVSDKECAHHKVLRLRFSRREIDLLEEQYVPYASRQQ